MPKYKQSKQDLEKHWKEQLGFIYSSVKEFDRGYEGEAKRIATSLRIIFQKSRHSHPLITQLNLENNLPLWSSSSLYTPSNLISSWLLLKMGISNKGFSYSPTLTDVSSRTFFLIYEDWWNEVIFDDKKNIFSRKDIVNFVANQDGGTHVDPYLNEKFADLTKRNALGWVDQDGNTANNNPAYSAIRQIAEEFLVSQSLLNKGSYTRKKDPKRLFEMRFIEEKRRFKWSTTDLTYSEETKKIVEKYRKEKRNYYLQKYPDGQSIEFIGR